MTDAKGKASEAIKSGKETLAQEGEHLKTAINAGIDAYKDTKKS
jgi:hypothetical protein